MQGPEFQSGSATKVLHVTRGGLGTLGLSPLRGEEAGLREACCRHRRQGRAAFCW